MLPVDVLKQAQEELLNWNNQGASVMEMSHRDPAYVRMAREAEQDLRDLLDVPDDYEVLFLQGGGAASSQPFRKISRRLTQQSTTSTPVFGLALLYARPRSSSLK